MNCKATLFTWCAILGFTSCRTTYNMSYIQVEVMKPALYALPSGVDTIAIFKRGIYKPDTVPYKYINVDNRKVKMDSSIHFSYLSNKCVDALADVLNSEDYFLKVINYRDSMNYLFNKDSLINYPKLHKKIGADVFIFLDYLILRDRFAESERGKTDFISNIKDKFPEFYNSTKVETIDADLLWTITFKGDTSIYICKQPDNLYYGNSLYPELFGNDLNHKLLLTNTAEYLGKSFSKKFIPSWEIVERTYYRSNNDDMLIAEKYLLDNNWMKAAAIYKRETKNSNQNIAAKATFNMALICEMEGNLDAANDWVNLSFSAFKNENQEHLFNCTQYSTILAKRKKEIELLEKHIRLE